MISQFLRKPKKTKNNNIPDNNLNFGYNVNNYTNFMNLNNSNKKSKC